MDARSDLESPRGISEGQMVLGNCRDWSLPIRSLLRICVVSESLYSGYSERFVSEENAAL